MTESCCDTPAGDARLPCPACGQSGRKVGPETVAALVRPEHRDRVQAAATWHFCATPGCPVAWYGPGGARVEAEEARIRIAGKPPGPPTPLCYCFGHSEEEIAAEVARTGTSTVPVTITAKVQAGECSCETSNPSGRCCLGEVRAAVRRHQHARAAAPEVPGKGERKALLVQGGAVLGAVVASACCWLPLALVAFGVSAGGVAATFERFRPFFAGLTVVLLALAWWLAWRPRRAQACATGACPPRAGRLQRWNRVLLVPVTLAAAAFLLFPSWGPALWEAPPPAATAGPAATTLHFQVGGMTCAACAASVRHAVGQVPGVLGTDLDEETGRLDVATTGASGVTTAIRRAVEAAGYTLEDAPPRDS